MSTALSPLDFHHGEALVRVASHYPTLTEVVFEAVQNALDAAATKITVVIDHLKRTLTVQDDGVGTSQAKFETALTSVCCSIKDADKLGQFGMGLIAPLGKCERFTFTSTPKSNPRSYCRWTFETEAIQRQEKIQGIPMEPMPELNFAREPKSRHDVPWRTQVKLKGFTRDRILSHVTTLALREGILERFSAAMKRYGTTVEITVVHPHGEPEAATFVADKYEGRRLPVEYVRDNDAGQTTFQLYVAKRTIKGRRGKVVIGEAGKDFRLAFSQFARHASDFLEADVIEAMTSGAFEGEILSERAKLDPNRKNFQLNEALVGLCATIETWFQQIGEQHIAKLKEEAEDDRYQRLGLRSMKVVEAFLQRPEFSHLMAVVKSFVVGTIGRHHVEPSARPLGLQPTPSVAVQGRGRTGGNGSGIEFQEPEVEHVQHTPLTVSGPRGRQRMMVKGNSLGLQFLYEEMEGSDKLWDLDRSAGILRFNTRHPLWAECEKDEKALMRFQEHIAIMALTLEAGPADWREKNRRMVDDAMPIVVFWLLNGDEIAGRKAGAGLRRHNETRKKKVGGGK